MLAPQEDDEQHIADEVQDSASAESETEAKKTKGFDLILSLSVVISLASLLSCLILPIWVYLAGTDSYEQRFETFKTVLIWPTLIYFVAGTIWAIKNNKEK